MDELLPGNDDPRRLVIREWLAKHPNPTNVQLAESGYVAPHWPEPWGLGADPVHQLIIDDELSRAGVSRPSNQIGIGWAAPTIIFAGTQEQKDRKHQFQQLSHYTTMFILKYLIRQSFAFPVGF